jgi:HSP20 family molecular chaperone IbpA
MEERTTPELILTPEKQTLSAGHEIVNRIEEINELIRLRAFELFASKGFNHGQHFEDWHCAESEILHPCPLDLAETETEFLLRANVSGFTENELEIHVEPRRIVINGRRQEAVEGTEGKLVYSERRANHIFRVLDLPASVELNEVKAVLSDGVLELTLSKASVGKKFPVLTKAATA